VKTDEYRKTALTFFCLGFLAMGLFSVESLASPAPAQTEGVTDAKAIDNATASMNTLKVAVVDHYAKFGSFPIGDNTFESTLEREGLLAKPASLMNGNGNSDYHVRVMNALSSTVLVTATNAAFNFEGGTTNQATGSVVIETVIFNVASQDARQLSLRVDGPKLTSPLSKADLKGRVKFSAIPTNGFGEVHVYVTHWSGKH
jgi:hypothetical protein